MNLLTTMSTTFTVACLAIHVCSQTYPVTINDVWNDDYYTAPPRGWLYTDDSATSADIITWDSSKNRNFHGPYIGDNDADIEMFGLQQDFYCNVPSSVDVTFDVAFCNTQSTDRLRFYTNDVLIGTLSAVNGAEYVDTSLDAICSYGWQAKGPFDGHNVTYVYYQLFHIRFEISVNSADEAIAVTDISITCNPLPTISPTSSINTPNTSHTTGIYVYVIAAILIGMVSCLLLGILSVMIERKRNKIIKEVADNLKVDVTVNSPSNTIVSSKPELSEPRIFQFPVNTINKTAMNDRMNGHGEMCYNKHMMEHINSIEMAAIPKVVTIDVDDTDNIDGNIGRDEFIIDGEDNDQLQEIHSQTPDFDSGLDGYIEEDNGTNNIITPQ